MKGFERTGKRFGGLIPIFQRCIDDFYVAANKILCRKGHAPPSYIFRDGNVRHKQEYVLKTGQGTLTTLWRWRGRFDEVF